MKLKFPLRKIKENMMATNEGEIWAYYRLKSTSVPITDGNKKQKLKQKMNHLLNELKDYVDVDMMMIPRDMTLEERFEELSQTFSTDCYDTAKYYADKTVEMLNQEIGMVYTYDWVIGVPLKSKMEVDSFAEGIQVGYSTLRSSVLSLVGMEVELSEKMFEDMIELEELAYNRMGMFQAERLKEGEMVYLNRLNFIRNMPHAVSDEVLNDDLETLTDAIIDPGEKKGYLQLESYEGKSVIAIMPISKTDFDLNSLHTAEVLQTLSFPVEFRLKMKFIPQKGTFGVEGKAKRSGLRLKVATQESRGVGNFEGFGIRKKRAAITNLQGKIEANENIVEWLACVVVYAKDYKECKQRCHVVRSLLKTRRIGLSRAISQQSYLFYKMLMGTRLEPSDKKWINISTVNGVAQNLMAINQRVGFRTGFYIGRVDPHVSAASTLQKAIYGSKNVVLMNPFSVNKWNESMGTASPHVAVTGETGMGKTFLVSLIFTFLSMMTQAKGLFIDPKTEKIKQVRKFLLDVQNQKLYPEYYQLLSTFHLVELDPNNPENWGVLDPITFLNGADAKDTAEAMIYQIVNLDDTRTGQAELSKAIRKVVERRSRGERVGMVHVVELLKENKEKEIREIGELLEERMTGSTLRLGFSDGSNAGLNFNKRITIVGILGLQVPKQNENPKYYTTSERNSLALLLPLGKFCEKFGSMNDQEETFEVFEEAWLFNTSAIGKKILNSIKRVGRSQNNMLIYSTQSVMDVTQEDDHGNFGTIFAFNEPKEEDKILAHIGIEDGTANRSWLSGMKKGQCLMLDPYKSVQKISVHCMFPEIAGSFATVEETVGAQAEMHYV